MPEPRIDPRTEEYLRSLIADRLSDLEALFVPEARLTFVMRVPGQAGVHLVVSKDDELAARINAELEGARGGTTEDGP